MFAPTALGQLAQDRHNELVAAARERRQASQVRALRRALRRARQAQLRLIDAEVSVMQARSDLASAPEVECVPAGRP